MFSFPSCFLRCFTSNSWLLALLLFTSAAVHAQTLADAEGEHAWRESNDPVAELWKRMEAGEASLDTSSDQKFLISLLKELDVPVESQVLVFSKTSLQKEYIDPTQPRALYFNEECYIGWVQGGDVEVVASNPGGELQYYLIHRPKPHTPIPTLVKSNQCMSCHVGGDLQIQSVHTRESGYPIGNEDRFVVTYESPLSERWGGWYVTGKHGHELHMGNVTMNSTVSGVELDRKRGANVISLDNWLALEPYPVGTSDIVALMVLEHQYVLHNTLQDSARAVRRMKKRAEDEKGGAGQIAYDENAQQRILRKHARKITEQLLYMGEYVLKDDGVSGSEAFQKAFQRNKQTSQSGASLKDFDLRSRMFKYRCSYMIHSATFKGMPEELRKAVYEFLGEVLSGKDDSGEYQYLTADECAQIRQILSDTEPEIRAVWQ